MLTFGVSLGADFEQTLQHRAREYSTRHLKGECQGKPQSTVRLSFLVWYDCQSTNSRLVERHWRYDSEEKEPKIIVGPRRTSSTSAGGSEVNVASQSGTAPWKYTRLSFQVIRRRKPLSFSSSSVEFDYILINHPDAHFSREVYQSLGNSSTAVGVIRNVRGSSLLYTQILICVPQGAA